MKNVMKKVLVFLIAACMMLNLTSLVWAAGTIPVPVSDSFRGSVYYQNANNVYKSYQNKSDAELFVRMALSQKGYRGSTSKGIYDGIGRPLGKFTEYSRYMNRDGQEWCACFVSWAARAAGISKRVIPSGTVARTWLPDSPNGGKFIKIWSDDFKTYKSYQPKVGDIALYTPFCRNCEKHMTSFSISSHAVIVCDVADKANKDGSWTFTTIERDGNTVNSRTLTTKDRRGKGSCTCSTQKNTGITNVPTVQGFFHPNWEDGRSAPNHLSGTNQSVVKPSTGATVSYPTNSTYLSKIQYTTNNAVVAAKVTKPYGSRVNYVGLVLYDNAGRSIRDKKFSVTNVPTSSTSFHTWFDIQKEIGVTLSPGTTYQYCIYTIVDNVRYSSPRWTFTTKAAAVSKPQVTVKYPTNSTYLSKIQYTTNNAVVAANITKPYGSRVNYVGLVLYDNAGRIISDKKFLVTNVSASTTSFHTWFDIQKEIGVTLSPGTTYKYCIYTIVDNVKYNSPCWTFTTKAAAVPKPQVTVKYPTSPTYLSKIKYMTNNAVVAANITKPYGSRVNYVGLVLYDSAGRLIRNKSFSVTNVPASMTSFHAWFDIQKEIGVTLQSRTLYKYFIYTIVDNATYTGPLWTFMTK